MHEYFIDYSFSHYLHISCQHKRASNNIVKQIQNYLYKFGNTQKEENRELLQNYTPTSQLNEIYIWSITKYNKTSIFMCSNKFKNLISMKI